MGCICFLFLLFHSSTYISFLMSGGAISASGYSSSTLGGLKHPVIDLRASLSSGTSLETSEDLLQTTQPTSGGAVTVVWQPCENCVDPSHPQQWRTDFRLGGQPVMQSRWMVGTAPHKSGICRDESRSDKHTQTSMDLRHMLGLSNPAITTLTTSNSCSICRTN